MKKLTDIIQYWLKTEFDIGSKITKAGDFCRIIRLGDNMRKNSIFVYRDNYLNMEHGEVVYVDNGMNNEALWLCPASPSFLKKTANHLGLYDRHC